MTTDEFASRVTWAGACAVAAIGAVAWWLAGLPAAVGVGGGGAIALVNFRWLARDVGRAVAAVSEGHAGLARLGRIGLRQFVTLGALGLIIAHGWAHGWAHPAGVGLGLAALPPVLLVQGIRSARAEARGEG